MSMPLKGIKVLDLTRLLPGPFCSLTLADFGAEVIKIEQPGGGDNYRRTKPLLKDTGSYYLLLNRNKKSITLNLKAEKGREVFLQLAKDADVVLEGFRPGVVKKLGIDYDTLKQINPQLVYCSISGYGQDGPYAQRSGHDINYISYAGVLSMTGRKGRVPAIPGVQIADLGGGAIMAITGILLALMARQQIGQGQYVDIAMLDGVISWLPAIAGKLFAGGTIPEQGADRLTGQYACYEVYQTKDGRFISLGANEPHLWGNLCRYFGREEFVHWQFNDERQAELKSFLREQFILRERDEWIKILEDVDVCIAPVLNLAEVFEDPQVLHRKMVFEMEHPRLGKIKQLGFPIKMSATPAKAETAPPELGEYTEDILGKLGYSIDELEVLRQKGVI